MALLPDPGVLRWMPSTYRPRLGPNDDEWMIVKRRYPTVLHICRESRHCALWILEKEKKEKRGTQPDYLGSTVRPFDPELDAVWLDSDHVLHQFLALSPAGADGRRFRGVERLALSSSSIWSLGPGNSAMSAWDLFGASACNLLPSLKRIDLVFEGPDLASANTDEYGDQTEIQGKNGKSAMYDEELRLETWAETASTVIPQTEVDAVMRKARAAAMIPDATASANGFEATFHAARLAGAWRLVSVAGYGPAKWPPSST
jgi:hypothetical protein